MICILLILSTTMTTFAYDKSIDTDLKDKSIYYVSGYRNNDCVLSANMYMIRRAAIINGTTCWDNVTVNKLRPFACTSKNGSSLKYSYEFDLDGVTYEVKHGLLTGSSDSRKSQLKKLLKDHPEGVVVRGRSTSGYGHGILVTEYSDGAFRAVDSAQNKGEFNKGIIKMTSTTVRNIGSCSHIWYIEEQTGKSKTAIKRACPEDLSFEYLEDIIKLSWDWDSDYHKIDKFVIYKSDTPDGEFKNIASTKKAYYDIKNKKDGKTYYYMVRGYVRKNEDRIYSDESKPIEIPMEYIEITP